MLQIRNKHVLYYRWQQDTAQGITGAQISCGAHNPLAASAAPYFPLESLLLQGFAE